MPQSWTPFWTRVRMLKRNLINILADLSRSMDQSRKLEHWIDINALSFTNSHIPPVNTNYPEPHIHRLPVELLQHIFLLIVNDMPDFPSIFSCGETTISANFASPPLVFTRVCCLWRAIALSTTGVWSRFQVALPGRFNQLHPFLPRLLQFWLACSGYQPLTLRTCQYTQPIVAQSYYSKADSQLLRVLLSAHDRWESAGFVSPIHDQELVRYRQADFGLRLEKIFDSWRFPGNGEIDVPQLRTLECYWSDITKFDAPNLTRLCIIDQNVHPIKFQPGKYAHQLYLQTYPYPTSYFPTPTCKNIRDLHLRKASAHIIRATSVIFPHLEAIVVDTIEPDGGRRDLVACSSLESMTLPLSSDNQHLEFIGIFNGFQLPMLQKLTVVGAPNEQEVDCILGALAIASCHVQVVDFQATKVDLGIVQRPAPGIVSSGLNFILAALAVTSPGVDLQALQNEADMGAVEPLLSVVREVTVHVHGVLRHRAAACHY